MVSSNSTYAVSIIAQRYIKVTLCTNQNWLGSLLVLEISSQMFTQGRIFGDQEILSKTVLLSILSSGLQLRQMVSLLLRLTRSPRTDNSK